MLKISVFGNPDYQPDAMPLKILPFLKERFPEVNFQIEDPNELNAPASDEWWIIDTVAGLKKVQLLSISDLKKVNKNRVSLHDFDLSMHLFWIEKLKKTKPHTNNQRFFGVGVIGIPPIISETEAVSEVVKILNRLRSSRR